MDLRAIVRHYRTAFKDRSGAELDGFRNESSLVVAIRRAALALTPEGKRYSHQTRLKREDLADAERRLTENLGPIEAASNFARLVEAVSNSLRGCRGLGELYIYDTTLRIGAKRGIMPDRLYLHAGTRDGARALGLDPKAKVVDRFELPVELRELEMHEVEDVLCIYKDHLSSARGDLDEARACWPEDEEDPPTRGSNCLQLSP